MPEGGGQLSNSPPPAPLNEILTATYKIFMYGFHFTCNLDELRVVHAFLQPCDVRPIREAVCRKVTESLSAAIHIELEVSFKRHMSSIL